MKKVFSFPIMIGIMIIVTANTATSQQLVAKANPIELFANDETGDPIYRNDINAKVLRSFFKKYGEIADANWYKSAKRVCGYFQC